MRTAGIAMHKHENLTMMVEIMYTCSAKTPVYLSASKLRTHSQLWPHEIQQIIICLLAPQKMHLENVPCIKRQDDKT
jgi:Fe2+ transport system protein B